MFSNSGTSFSRQLTWNSSSFSKSRLILILAALFAFTKSLDLKLNPSFLSDIDLSSFSDF
jgi:hypothetical protein